LYYHILHVCAIPNIEYTDSMINAKVCEKFMSLHSTARIRYIVYNVVKL